MIASKKIGIGAVLVSALATTASARADSLSCGGRIVSDGDSRYEVKATCGEPDDTTQRVEYRTVRGRVVGPCAKVSGKLRCEKTEETVIEVVVDEWTYDFGKNRFIEFVTFEQGKLVSVRSGSYGHK